MATLTIITMTTITTLITTIVMRISTLTITGMKMSKPTTIMMHTDQADLKAGNEFLILK